MLSNLRGLVEQIDGKRVLVIGDLMLDTYIFGTAERLSPEAPVPVVPVQKRLYSPGGAANVAANLRGLGAEVTLAGFVGDDIEGDRLFGMALSHQIVLRRGITTSKIRVVANGQHVVRIDSEERPSKEECMELARKIEAAPRNFDWIILSDYCKGVVSGVIIHWAIKTYGKRVSVDSKRRDLSVFSGCGIITPNTREAEQALGYPIVGNDGAHFAVLDLIGKFNLDTVLLTRGKDGMILRKGGGDTVFIPAVARSVYDVTGAGDTVVAVLSGALAAGGSARDAAILSGIAAGVVVEEVGTSAITKEKLLGAIQGTRRRDFRPYLMGRTS